MKSSTAILNTSAQENKNQIEIEQLIQEASVLVGPVWPLKNGIACNPLLGLQHKDFWDAICESESVFSPLSPDQRTKEETVNWHFIKWIQAFLDQGQATWKMPDRHLGFYRCWRLLVPHDQLLIQNDASKEILAFFPENAADAIALGLTKLGIQSKDKVKYLAEQLIQLPGWAGYVKWQTQWKLEKSEYPIDLIEFLAVRIVIHCILEKQIHKQPKTEKNQNEKRKWTKEKIEIEEIRYKNELVEKLRTKTKKNIFFFRKKDPLGQLIFCIDVRSESFRKQLEDQGHWETFGFAGFFGIPISLKKNSSAEKSPFCPVLVKPKHDVLEVSQHSILSHFIGKINSIFLGFYKNLKYQFSTPFALAETIGPWSAIWMSLKSLSPKGAHLLEGLHKKIHIHNFCCLEKSISFEKQVEYAQSALSIIGLTQDFAPIVVFCGHGSTVQNNPHASTLNCGACGGNAGGPNARLIASILNSPKVRLELKKRAIIIPEDTLFLGAEHNTTTDTVTLFYDKKDNIKHIDLIEKLNKDLKNAQKTNTSNRMHSLGSSKGVKEAIRKSVNWSETRPEWGLAKNAAFIVGPRTLTEKLDLQSRCFLHSYDFRLDSDGKYLETILTAPMIVAQWINTQYFFSAFNPIIFGSGSKITHNVVGKIGVMQGNGSDLMHGLPLQSIQSTDIDPYHVPIRLLTIVLASKDTLNTIIKKHSNLQDLFFNHWVKLISIDPIDLKIYELEKKDIWNEI